MVIFECITCKYSTNIKSHYTRHLESKKHKFNVEFKGVINEKNLENLKKYTNDTQMIHNPKKRYTKNTQIYTNDTQKDTNECKEHFCEFCGKYFKSRPSMLRHIRKHCKIKKELDMEEEKKDLIIQEQKEQINKLIDKVGNKTTINTNSFNHNNMKLNNNLELNNNQTHNTQVNTNNNVQLNCFRNEDLSMLTNKVKNKMIKGPFKMIPNMMKMIYFNDNYPQNKTLKLVNRKDNILKIHGDKGWEYVNKQEVIDEIIDTTNYEVDTYYDMKTEEISNFVNNTYKRFRTLFESRDKNLWTSIKKDVDLVLWNNM